jgi:hypothetical protein
LNSRTEGGAGSGDACWSMNLETIRGGPQAVSKPFCELARHLVETLPRNAERTVALRKLLEGKDAAVRASLDTSATPDPRPTPIARPPSFGMKSGT